MSTSVARKARPVMGFVLLIACSVVLRADAPAGWRLIGKDPADYEAGTDMQVVYKGRPSAYVKCVKVVPEGVAGLSRDMPPDKYAGKRVRFSAAVKSAGVELAARLVLHVNRAQDRLTESTSAFIRGDTDWQNYEVVMYVPQDTTSIYFGIALQGPGTVWLNDVKFEVVGSDVPKRRDEPANLDFERP